MALEGLEAVAIFVKRFAVDRAGALRLRKVVAKGLGADCLFTISGCTLREDILLVGKMGGTHDYDIRAAL